LKIYFKIFLLAFVSFTAIMAGAYFAIDTHYTPDYLVDASSDEFGLDDSNQVSENAEELEDEDESLTDLERLSKKSNRINIIAFGLNESLADTMMFISYDPDSTSVDIISIPRDTYHVVEGYNSLGQKKMNAIYGLKEVGGVNGMKTQISEFLGVPIDYYVKIDFQAVEAIVDVLGGYEVRVPYNMDYDDEWASPTLHIHLKKGYQTLNGADTVKFLRFRKNNSGTISEGDIQRIPRQQAFVNTMLQKALSSKLPSVINTAMKYVKTDMTLEEALSLGIGISGMQAENIVFHTVEGEDKMINGLSYWIHDPASLENLLLTMYGYESDTFVDNDAPSLTEQEGN